MNRFGKRAVTPRAQKPFTMALTPALLAECRAILARQMALASGGRAGRPSLVKQRAMAAAKRSGS